MKKDYETPEMEVFSFEAKDRVMDSGCSLDGSPCGCQIGYVECPIDNTSGF